jgi:hypothetical protein
LWSSDIHPEDAGDVFLQNVDNHLKYCKQYHHNSENKQISNITLFSLNKYQGWQ